MIACERAVREVIAEEMGCAFDEATLDTRLGADLHADELDILELVGVLEESFGVEGAISVSEVDRWVTVRDVVASVDAVTSESGKAARRRASLEAAGQAALFGEASRG